MSDVKNKYHLTLTDSESKMTLRHEKPGYIEVGINEGDVEFSMPTAFLQAFVESVGGTIDIPDTIGGKASTGPGTARVVLGTYTGDKKINYIKAVRASVSETCGYTLGLRETKETVEKAMRGEAPELYEGPREKAEALCAKLRREGYPVDVEDSYE